MMRIEMMLEKKIVMISQMKIEMILEMNIVTNAWILNLCQYQNTILALTPNLGKQSSVCGLGNKTGFTEQL